MIRKRTRGARVGVALAAALTLLAAPGALASSTQESTFQDDDLLIYNTHAGTAKTLDTLASLGVQRIRVSVFWRLVAPDPLSTTRPANFDAGDPAAYPQAAWQRYDDVIAMAQARGIGVNLNITSPAPLWATGTPDRADIAKTYRPQAKEFALFVRAVASRYTGTYVPPAPPPAANPTPPEPPTPRDDGGLLGGLLGPNPNGSGAHPAPPPLAAPSPAGSPLPRVDYWSIWNEPNQPGWLTPQWTANVDSSPALYRDLLDAAYSELQSTGHGGDTILIGETAPKGLNRIGETRAIKPLRFIRSLYCVSDSLTPLRGAVAAARGCPTTADASAAFPTQHPALFRASGWAHHPYELTFAPNRAPRDRDMVTIANLNRLGSTLDVIRQRYGLGGGLPLYLTEFGYMSNPPSPLGVSLARQAAYLNEAEYIAYHNPRVQSVSQFLLVDSPPLARRSAGPVGYGVSFQTGLMFRSGRAKPSLSAYRLPVYVRSARRGRRVRVRVWGLVRSSAAAGAQHVAIEFRPGSRGRFRQIATATTTPRPAYFERSLRLRRAGQLCLRWRDPRSGVTYRSRIVAAG